MDHYVYAPSQWETMLHCNVVSHWLGTYKKIIPGEPISGKKYCCFAIIRNLVGGNNYLPDIYDGILILAISLGLSLGILSQHIWHEIYGWLFLTNNFKSIPFYLFFYPDLNFTAVCSWDPVGTLSQNCWTAYIIFHYYISIIIGV